MVRSPTEASDGLALAGAAVAIIGTFLPWITAGFSAGPIDVSTAVAGIDTTLGLVTALVAVGGAVLLIAFEAADIRGTTVGIAGAVVVLGGVVQLLDLGGFAGAGLGLYISIFGGVMLAAGGAVAYQRS
ncbi:MAG: hypothetical protein ABEH64_06575 [Salinirussus sp.]